MDFYDSIGLAALGSRLRRLGDRLAEDVKPIYALYGTELQPRWFPVIYLLGRRPEMSVTAIADDIGHTHASVSQIVGEMVKRGYARLKKARNDGRKTLVALTPQGRNAARKLDAQCVDVGEAVAALQAEMGADLWNALARAEVAIARQGLYARVMKAGAQRADAVKIVAYAPRYAKAFKALNEAWITTYFTLEDADRRMLDDPDGTILKTGGAILIALRKGKPVGTSALIPHGTDCFELAKMAVTPQAQGAGIGWKLGQAAIAKATAAGARRLYLESNRRLTPAINLYRKLGFVEIDGAPSQYERCDIWMERVL